MAQSHSKMENTSAKNVERNTPNGRWNIKRNGEKVFIMEERECIGDAVKIGRYKGKSLYQDDKGYFFVKFAIKKYIKVYVKKTNRDIVLD